MGGPNDISMDQDRSTAESGVGSRALAGTDGLSQAGVNLSDIECH